VLVWPSNYNIFHIFLCSHSKPLRFRVIFNSRKPINIFKLLNTLVQELKNEQITQYRKISRARWSPVPKKRCPAALLAVTTRARFLFPGQCPDVPTHYFRAQASVIPRASAPCLQMVESSSTSSRVARRRQAAFWDFHHHFQNFSVFWNLERLFRTLSGSCIVSWNDFQISTVPCKRRVDHII
jgi:hypothetical protein